MALGTWPWDFRGDKATRGHKQDRNVSPRRASPTLTGQRCQQPPKPPHHPEHPPKAHPWFRPCAPQGWCHDALRPEARRTDAD